jgi:hypothetical protein
MKGAKGVQSQNQTHAIGGGEEIKGETKSQRHHLLEKHENLDNFFGDVPCHATKIMTHT